MQSVLTITTRVLLVLALNLLIGVLASCSAPTVRGGVNGIHYRMVVGRPAVSGGTACSIGIHAKAGPGGDTAELFVDGVPFGTVQRGDRVYVSDKALVTVGGELREPLR